MDQLGEDLRKLILAGVGAAAATKEKSEVIFQELIRKGELNGAHRWNRHRRS